MNFLRFVSGLVRHSVSSWRSPLAPAVAPDVAARSASDSGPPKASEHDGWSVPFNLIGLGIGPEHWAFHAWLQWLPLPTDDCTPLEQVFMADASSLKHVPTIGLQLGLLEHLQERDWNALRGMTAVFDPSPERLQILCDQGVEAQLLAPTAVPNGWLNSSAQQLQDASLVLGLPSPEVLCEILEGQDEPLICLGSAGQQWEADLPAGWVALPAFDDLVIPDWQSARFLACWVNACCRQGLQLVRIHPTLPEFSCTPYRALERPGADPGSSWITPPMVWGSVLPHELLEEVSWLRAGTPVPEIPPTPQPEPQLLWINRRERPVSAAICISLYNYADRIATALDSCASQTQDDLELLIVDDASQDEGVDIVRQWLDQYGSRFANACLLSHPSNAGLAAARNTAFAAARADWCFVLDADNLLEPDAVKHCLSIALHCSDQVAVVHPLVALRQEHRHPSQPDGSLLTRISWQKPQFLHGNLIDAMALIRRSAWERVGGYTHIPGGWEDFDFWCKLTEAGFGGVLCPQKLAVYNRHQHSMQATQTIHGQRSLKRIMMNRHPWLRFEEEIVI